MNDGLEPTATVEEIHFLLDSMCANKGFKVNGTNEGEVNVHEHEHVIFGHFALRKDSRLNKRIKAYVNCSLTHFEQRDKAIRPCHVIHMH